MPADDKLKIPLPQAIVLKHLLNQSITYGPYTAQEFVSLSKLSVQDYAVIRRTHVEIFGRRPYSAIVGLIASALLFAFTDGWLRAAGAVIAFITAIVLAKREGHEEGFVAGYENGVDLGVKRALRVSDEDAHDAHDHALEMEVDAIALAALEKKQREPS